MKFVAILDADMVQTPLGTRSRLGELLAGKTLLARTIERLGQCKEVGEIVVSYPKSQLEAVQAAVSGCSVRLWERPDGHPPYRPLVRTARKWSLDGWRGGVGGSSILDEYTDTIVAAQIATETKADAVMIVPPGAVLLDPAMADEMANHFVTMSDDMRMTFTQSPPGLVPSIFHSDLLGQLAKNKVPPGWTLSYKPDTPSVDLAVKKCCYACPEPVRCSSGRLTGDTDRSVAAMQAIIDEGVADDAVSIGRWLMSRALRPTESLPHEVEIELTTEDALADTVLRPRGERVGRRGPIDVGLVEKLASELGGFDDTLVVLGGHGDPVLHPRFGEILRALRDKNIYGVAVYTTGQRMTEQAVAAIIENRVDVVVFQLDAWTAETFARINGGGSLENGCDALNRLGKARQAAKQVEPVIMPQMTKCRENVEELDSFFDGWTRQVGCAAIVGYSHYGHRLSELATTEMSPPNRSCCSRLMNRCVVLADGAVCACDQDYASEMPMGNLNEQTLGEVWLGEKFAALRSGHVVGGFGDYPLCSMCGEWHRP